MAGFDGDESIVIGISRLLPSITVLLAQVGGTSDVDDVVEGFSLCGFGLYFCGRAFTDSFDTNTMNRMTAAGQVYSP